MHRSQDARPIPTGWPPTALPSIREIDFVPPSASHATILVDLLLDSISVRAVVDTAGQITVISEDLFSQLPNATALPAGEPIVLRGAGKGSQMKGWLIPDIPLQMGHKTFPWKCCVAPIADTMILGLDFLRAHHGVIDLPANTLRLQELVIPLVLADRSTAAHTDAHIVRKITLAPGSGLEYWCEIEPVPGGEDLWFQPVELDEDLWIAPALVRNQKLIPFVIINGSSHYQTLKPGTPIGSVVPVGSASIQEVVVESETRVQDGRQEQPVQNSEETSTPNPRHTGQVPPHLEDLLEKSSAGLETVQRQQLGNLLLKFQDVFSKSDTDIGCYPHIRHTIDTGDAAPIKERMRRSPLGFEQEEDKHLESMLRNKVIRPSQSPWSAAPVLIRKKDGSVRWCLDYRRLNDVTRKDLYPLPLIEECLDTLAGSAYFSTLDMASGYWQIDIEEADKPKTAFVTKRGLFEMNKMAFGLCNAPATFQRVVNQVLGGLLWKSVLAYLDDIIVLGKDFQDHLRTLQQVLLRLREANLKLKPRKCHLLRQQVQFLGRVVSREGVAMDPSKIEKITGWPTPRNSSDLLSFLGLVNYHREHVAHFSAISAPLYSLLKKGVPFQWSAEQEQAFRKLKEALSSAPVLAYPQQEGVFILDTDASNLCIGAELSQMQDGVARVIAYGSAMLSAAQQNYCTTRKELLAVVRFTRQYRHYLLGRPFLVRTDHSSLTWLMRFRQANGQLARWLEELSQYDFTIAHRAGHKHGNADSLSRLTPHETCNCYLAGTEPHMLPCGGCKYCQRMHEQ